MKVFIKNRKGQKMAVLVEEAKAQKGLAFVMHGLGGFKEQDHIRVFADAFREKGFTVVLFDTTNSLGESDGNYELATTTNYYEDLEDVIAWASKQPWFEEPFCMAGHSLGSISITMFAEEYPERVKALAPISTVISGAFMHSTRRKEDLDAWKERGYIEEESISKPGFMKKTSWALMEDVKQYDILHNANRLTMPVLLIVGSKDHGTPTEHQKMLFDKLTGPKEFHVIDGAAHNFRKPKYLEEIREIFLKWIDSFTKK